MGQASSSGPVPVKGGRTSGRGPEQYSSELMAHDAALDNQSNIFVDSPGSSPPANDDDLIDQPITAPGEDVTDADNSKKQLVPTVFRWAHGGQSVSVLGTFNQWRERVPLRCSQEEFVTIIELEAGTTHQYKFIVDNVLCHNPDLPTAPDRAGAINNTVDVNEVDGFELDDFGTLGGSSPIGSYNKLIPTLDASTAPPPALPVQLKQILLNHPIKSDNEPNVLPVPSHVVLHHLYAHTITAGTMVLGVTSRYEAKYITTILYRSVDD